MEVESQMVLSFLVWALATKPGSPEDQQMLLTNKPPLQSTDLFVLKQTFTETQWYRPCTRYRGYKGTRSGPYFLGRETKIRANHIVRDEW